MKLFGQIALVILSLVTLAGCPEFMTREDIKKQEEEKALKEQVSNIQAKKADDEMKYTDMQNDLRTMAGRVEALDHNLNSQQQQRAKENEALRKTIEAQNDKIKLLEQHLEATETRLTAAIQALSSSAAAAPAPQNSGHGAAVTGGGAKESGKKNEGSLYAEAEELFAKKDFKKAIVKYQAYRDKNPKGHKLADATYKIGVCFAEMGMKQDAKDFFQETIQNYAGTPPAKKAKFRLTQLK